MQLTSTPTHVPTMPIPAGVGLDRDSGGIAEPPKDLQYADVGEVTYTSSKGTHTYELVAGDFNHAGHVIQGTFRDAVRIAREESVMGVIDLPELGSTAVFRTAKPDQWVVAPLMGIPQHANPDDVEEPALGEVQIDPTEGDVHGPDGVFDELGYGRPGHSFNVQPIDANAFTVTAARDRDDLVAIIGVDHMISFDAALAASLVQG